MKKKLVATIFIALLGGLGGGYGLGYIVYQPQITILQTSLSNLQAEVSALHNKCELLNTTYQQLKTGYETLSETYNELKSLLRPSQPEFSIVDLRLTDENFYLPQEMPGLTAYLTLQNIGKADATEVYIRCEDLFINHTGNISFCGETKLDTLHAGKAASLMVPFKWSGVGGGNPIGINVTVTSAEGASLSFIYNSVFGVAYSIEIINVTYSQKPWEWGWPLNYTEYRYVTEITIRNIGNWTFNLIEAYGFLANGSLGSNRGFDPHNPMGPQPAIARGGEDKICPEMNFTIRMWDYPKPEEKLAYVLIFLATSYTWIHIAVDTQNI